MNVLVIMSDEHSNNVMGCSGHQVARTATLDRLAKEGTLFTQSYTNCPVCTPARASFFTGRYVNELGTWDNATPYDGQIKGMSQHLAEHGQTMHSIGKLDLHPDGRYDGLEASRPGHRNRIDVGAYFRETGEAKPLVEERYQRIGIREGLSNDQLALEETVQWLKQRSKKQKSNPEKPWFLYVGFSHPHFPFYVKKDYWDYYDNLIKDVPESLNRPFTELNEPLHALRHYFRSDVVDEETIRRMHVGYYALTNELDDNIGTIIRSLEEEDLYDDTLIIYTSDHGEQLGRHGLWFKCSMYQETSNVPLIVKGPNVRQGNRVDHPVSLVDIFPTVCDALSIPLPEDVPGRSLLKLAGGETDESRNDFVFSEYHAHGMPVGMYMIRWSKWKYIYFTGGVQAQLFDLEQDPEEMKDLAADLESSPFIQDVLMEGEKRLRSVCDPEETEERAKAFQAKIKQELGLESFNVGDPASSGYVDKKFKVPHPEYKMIK
ncbi:sulfatase-like hydrolase/transferase [Paenibacillus radicis (ex Xue et al. 2023)]|uniref:Sulfatase-like hydrolase/transferase n=1 Tax=Paenibacillus radicis (ex Xue et al. 2023) TaxID=2972489 RepID=A0ABT1YIG4_9BACL|nr:sulfatase-like hydrolase/transferase [Paenibacillus radicis (ex Xue et al. 2023)]MCR8632979.1 sulfatase-like hydrolase/transferase [Paenibacillus radicis (ex Xue et al. 2023)]